MVKSNYRLFQFSNEQIAARTPYSIATIESWRRGWQTIRPFSRRSIAKGFRREDLFDEVAE